jgi:hypothetical protein
VDKNVENENCEVEIHNCNEEGIDNVFGSISLNINDYKNNKQRRVFSVEPNKAELDIEIG